MTTALKKVTWKDEGSLDVSTLIDNIETVRDAVDALELIHNSVSPACVNYAVDAHGDHVALGEGVRGDMKLKQAFIQAGTEYSDGEDTEIDLLVNGVYPMCDTISIKAGEGRGKVVIGNIQRYPVITPNDEIIIKSSTDRRIVVNMVFRSV